ncbi:MAG: hypothetical protein Q8P05_01795 [Candidatus Diapherotrites archaeon]|nr:hypothetical protein [Candidatus Diapherotrites archaeon]MDZ4256749.1 hypothetical protein [archaeon]
MVYSPAAMRWHLVGVLVVALAVVIAAYGTNIPRIFGHSPDEIALKTVVYDTDCTNFQGYASGAGNPCRATCILPDEVAVGGNCISFTGYAYQAFGLTDASTNQKFWECSDGSHGPSSFLRAQVICLKVSP